MVVEKVKLVEQALIILLLRKGEECGGCTSGMLMTLSTSPFDHLDMN